MLWNIRLKQLPHFGPTWNHRGSCTPHLQPHDKSELESAFNLDAHILCVFLSSDSERRTERRKCATWFVNERKQHARRTDGEWRHPKSTVGLKPTRPRGEHQGKTKQST